MELVGGPPVVAAIAGVAFLLVVLAVLHFRYRIFRRRKARGRAKSTTLGGSRIEILETKVIDANRKFVLLRCDDIEHLVMVGGPADVVVENDVRKVRGPGAPPAKLPGFETERRAAASTPPVPTKPFDIPVAAAPRTPEPKRLAADARQASVPSRAPAVQPPLARAGTRSAEPHPVASADAQNRASVQRPADSNAGRREPTPPRRVAAGQNPPPPNRSIPQATQTARPVRTNGRAEPGAGLPAAQIPWSDPDSIENEIVRALRFDPQTRGGASASGRREPVAAKPAMDSSATLGDLADRLEEALAREMQSGAPLRKPEPVLEDFSFDTASDARPSEPPPPPAPKERERLERRDPERTERRERSEPPPRPTLAAAPEPEARREPPPQPERREETPVISLNSRRREAADPLEDEMARLLGELTSDTKGR